MDSSLHLQNDIKVIKILVAAGSDLNVLTSSIIIGNKRVVKILIKNDVDVNAGDSLGYTPLMYAIVDARIKFIKLLLDNGADINARDHYGYTPIMHATKIGHTNVVELLRRYGARE